MNRKPVVTSYNSLYKVITPELLSKELNLASEFKANGSDIPVTLKVFLPDRYLESSKKKILESLTIQSPVIDYDKYIFDYEKSSFHVTILPQVAVRTEKDGRFLVQMYNNNNITDGIIVECNKKSPYIAGVMSNIVSIYEPIFKFCQNSRIRDGRSCNFSSVGQNHVHFVSVLISRVEKQLLKPKNEEDFDMERLVKHFIPDVEDEDRLFISGEFSYNPKGKPDHFLVDMDGKSARNWVHGNNLVINNQVNLLD